MHRFREDELDDLCARAVATPLLEAAECLTILRDHWLEQGVIADDSADVLDGWHGSIASMIGDREVVMQRMRRETERAVLRAARAHAEDRVRKRAGVTAAPEAPPPRDRGSLRRA